jgi:hypothetical protein
VIAPTLPDIAAPTDAGPAAIGALVAGFPAFRRCAPAASFRERSGACR